MAVTRHLQRTMHHAYHDDQGSIALSKHALPDEPRRVLLHQVARAPLIGQLLVCVVPGPGVQ